MAFSDSDSPLSSPPPSEDEAPISRHVDVKPPPTKRQKSKKPSTTTTKIKLKAPAASPRSPSPQPKKKWKEEPPHVPTLADSHELAIIVMFRSRFADAFKGVPNLGCQDIERGIVDSTPSEQVEQLLCALVSLCLNRKKPVERGHHNRALEEAIHANQFQWPKAWNGRNPLAGGKRFGDLDTQGRLDLLKALINWTLSSSEQIRAMIADNYKGSRREDDLNVAISVQPCGRDGLKRKYWLIEGRDDTPFRLYRETATEPDKREWINVAGTIDELRAIAHELSEDGTKLALALKSKIEAAIPRFEEGEKKRQKREYRATRKAMFQQPSFGPSLYEGRTRGKRIKYTFSDHEDEGQTSSVDDTRSRRSARSSRNTPLPAPSAIAPDQPRYTASGRQIRRPQTGMYGESKISSGAPSEAGSANTYNYSAPVSEGDEWKGDSQGEDTPEEAEEDADDESEWDDTAFLQQPGEKKSLRIILKVNKERLSRTQSPQSGGKKEDVHMQDPPGVQMANGHGPPVATATAQAV